MCLRYMGLAFVTASLVGQAAAQTDPTVFNEQHKLVRVGKPVSSLGSELFGDRVNLYAGALSFTQTDVAIPGNSLLPVAVTRKYAAGGMVAFTRFFGDWDLDLPSISGVFAVGSKNKGWAAPLPSNHPNLYKRCSYFMAPLTAIPNVGLSIWEPYEFWHGTHLNVNGAGGEILNRNVSQNPTMPADGNTRPLVTRSGWQIRCLSSLHALNLNDTTFHKGEGFLALSPEGVQYRFDWMVTRDVEGLKKRRGGSQDILLRAEFTLYPTQITDRHGNTVNLNFDPGNQRRLTSITSNDGRSISFGYDSWNRITSASDGVRTWTYTYDAATALGRLVSVGLPDGTAWQLSLNGLNSPAISYLIPPQCNPGTLYETPVTGSITHPSGALGSFTVKSVTHGRKVATFCDPNVNGGWEFYPRNYATRSLVSKTLSGPGMAPATWSYAYAAVAGSDPSCTSCPSSKAVEVTDPRGVRTRHTFGIHVLVNEGHLLQLDEAWNGSTALRTTVQTYRDRSAGPYPAYPGYSINESGSSMPDLHHAPMSQRTITVDGTAFTWSATAFDSFARPLSVGRASSLGYSRGETVEYHDHYGKWVLGQTRRVTTPGFAYSAEEHTYNATTAMREASYAFGALQHTSGYNADGTLAWRADPAGRTTGFTDYYRGVARRVTHPDAAFETAVVDDRGLVTAHSNAAGTTTQYGYDAMGRPASMSYPPEAGMAYHATTSSFMPVAAAEYGIAAGHWRQTVATGNARIVRYYDALWRVRMERTWDAANEAATRSVSESRYDAEGRVVFQSYAQRDIAAVDGSQPGTSTVYDTLGRVSQVTRSSELGNLNTVTEYLGGFQRRITDPRNNASTQGFFALDDPGQAQLAWANLPLGVSVSIARDAYGKAQSINRSGGGASATRNYVYDAYQRLCKTIEPETGATVQAYDGAGNIAWRASGNALPSATSCDQASVPGARKVSFGYDGRNWLTSTSFGDGSPGIGRSYTSDGLPYQVWSNGTTWTYAYNNRRLLTTETLNAAGADYSFSHAYDAHGHRSSLVHGGSTGGAVVDYAPNALGQPTRAGGWATYASYHPDGSLAGFTLPWGSVFTMTQNARGLPERWRYSGVLEDSYSYDANGNVSTITDLHEGGATSRSMGYDALDRLAWANGPWGAASYGYDSLDNLRSSVVGARSLTHNVDSTNRLTSLSGSQSVSFAYDANGNVTQRGAQSYVFDIGNRLSAATGVASYVYDGHGRRVREQRADGSVITSAYTQDGLPRWDSVAGDRIYLGRQLVAQRSNGGYMHIDALGSVVARTGSALELLGRTRYEPYGAMAAGSAPVRIGFTGHVDDSATGLVYMQQRYYEPLAGRFLSVDPVTTDASTGGHFNRYVYGNSNPYRYIDPDGRVPVPLVLKALDVAVTVAEVAAAGQSGGLSAALKAGGEALVSSAVPGSKALSAVSRYSRAAYGYRSGGATAKAVRQGAEGTPCP